MAEDNELHRLEQEKMKIEFEDLELKRRELEMRRQQIENAYDKMSRDKMAGKLFASTPKTYLPNLPTGGTADPTTPVPETSLPNHLTMPTPIRQTPTPNQPTTPNDISFLQQYLDASRLQYQSCMDTMRLPPSDMVTFDGDPLKNWQFARLFTSLVDKETVSCNDKLTRLLQYTKGDARDAIVHCVYNPDPSLGFSEAWKRLKERFGDSHAIADKWIAKSSIGGTRHIHFFC